MDAVAELARLKSREEEALRKTLLDPIALPEHDDIFFIRVKVDHEGIFRPRPLTYVYEAVEKVIVQERDQIFECRERVTTAARIAGFDRIPVEERDSVDPFINNPMYPIGDALALYGMIAALKPRRIIEVGSGYSTRFMRRAIIDANLNTKITCINPVPTTDIRQVADDLILRPVHEVDLSLFDTLDQNDLLVWDGSHIVFNGTDPVVLYLEILPRIRPGVFLHIHDVQLPWEYEAGYCAHYYNEQYLLATLLLNSRVWKTRLPLTWLKRHGDPEFVVGSAFWMEARAS